MTVGETHYSNSGMCSVIPELTRFYTYCIKSPKRRTEQSVFIVLLLFFFLRVSLTSSPLNLSTFSLYCIVPYMAFCEWVLLGNWSAVKHSDLVRVFKMIMD